MKACARVVVTCAWLLLIAAAALLSAIREYRIKRRLGPAYEGPLEDNPSRTNTAGLGRRDVAGQ